MDCPICLEKITDDDVWICKYCDKYVHETCIIKWVFYSQKHSCPLCRNKVVFIEVENNIDTENDADNECSESEIESEIESESESESEIESESESIHIIIQEENNIPVQRERISVINELRMNPRFAIYNPVVRLQLLKCFICFFYTCFIIIVILFIILLDIKIT
jgi:hypothetical protein